MSTTLIIGGTSGLGLELAKIHAAQGNTVIITGRKDPQLPEFQYRQLTIGADTAELSTDLEKLLAGLPPVDTLIYAAGYYQEGRIDELEENQILEMANVGLLAPVFLTRHLKKSAPAPLELIFITSSSQYTPREVEPLYTAVKAGLGMLGNSLSLDPRIGKVLVAAPAGMKTPFWNGERDLSDYLEPQWVAEQIAALMNESFKYTYAKILRGPARVEVVETRE